MLRGNFELVYLVLPLIVLAWIFAKHFNIVGMGRDFSKNLGVNYTLVLFSGLTIAAMITAAIVSVVGSISYIGLIVPNLIAIFKGDDLRSTLADTALFGALFVLCCDVIGRLVIAPMNYRLNSSSARSAVFSSSRSSSTDFVLGACRSTKGAPQTLWS